METAQSGIPCPSNSLLILMRCGPCSAHQGLAVEQHLAAGFDFKVGAPGAVFVFHEALGGKAVSDSALTRGSPAIFATTALQARGM